MLRRTMMAAIGCVLLLRAATADELPGTKPLTAEGDIAAQMVAGIDKYFMRELDAAAKGGAERWRLNTSSKEAYVESIKPNRERLRKLLGVIDERVKPVTMEYVGTDTPSSLVAETPLYKVYVVRWPVLPGVDGEGLLLEPMNGAKASVVALPDADQTPEQIVGLAPGVAPDSQFARRLTEVGCRVVVPVLIDRKPTSSPSPILKRDTNIPHREFVWRMAYEMGRQIIGYEVQKVLAAVDWFQAKHSSQPVGVFGYGEGGLIAFYAGALDPRIKATVVSGVGYGTRGEVWQEPIDRSVWASLPEFRDEHLRLLFGGRMLIFEHSLPPKFELANPPGYRQQAAAGRLAPSELVRQEIATADSTGRPAVNGISSAADPVPFDWWTIAPPKGEFGHSVTIAHFITAFSFAAMALTHDAPTELRKSNDATPSGHSGGSTWSSAWSAR